MNIVPVELLVCILYAFLNRCVSASSYINKEERARLSVRGRELLMNNLIRFHACLDPVQLISASNDYVPQGNQLPQDLLVYLGNEILCSSEINNMFSTCHYANQTRIQMINDRLVQFNEHYLFEEQWMNNLMYVIIKEHFPGNINLNNENIHDHIELMTLKYIERCHKQIPESIPRPLYHAILTFFHETVYGPRQMVPSDLSSWLGFMCSKITGFKFPLTINFLTLNFEQSIHARYFEFMLEPRTRAEKEQFLLHNISSYMGPEDVSSYFIFDWNFEGTLSEEHAKKFLEKLTESQIYSEHLLNRIELTPIIDEFLMRPSIEYASSFEMYRQYLQRKSGISFSEQISDCETYIRTRDLNNPLNLAELQSFKDFEPWKAFHLTATKELPHLTKMDMLSKLIRSGLVPLCFVEELSWLSSWSVLEMFAVDSLPFFELVLIEYPYLINLIDLYSSSYSTISERRKDLILETQYARNNPLASLSFIRINNAFPGEYNLNVKYIIDCDPEDLDDTIFQGLKIILGNSNRTLTFRRILKLLGNGIISMAFGLSSPDDFQESAEQKASYPVISMRAFLNNPNSVI